MRITTRQQSGAMVVSIENERLDANIAADFKSAMRGFITNGNLYFVLDLHRVN
ncbi:MAG: anti-sigma factor antagonist, partial [Proteobacteria bacterium]